MVQDHIIAQKLFITNTPITPAWFSRLGLKRILSISLPYFHKMLTTSEIFRWTFTFYNLVILCKLLMCGKHYFPWFFLLSQGKTKTNNKHTCKCTCQHPKYNRNPCNDGRIPELRQSIEFCNGWPAAYEQERRDIGRIHKNEQLLT